MIDFPASPTPGQVFTASNGVIYIFNNGAWTTSLTPWSTDAPSDGAVYGRKDALWQKSVNLFGDTMAGALTIAPSVSMALLNLSGVTGIQKQITFQTSLVNRWTFNCNNAAESGANAGSDFSLARWDDAGVSLGTVFSVARATGAFRLPSTGTTSAPTLTLGGVNSGINVSVGSQLDFVCNGANRMTLGIAALALSVPLTISHNNSNGNTISQSGSGVALKVTNLGTGDSLLVEDSTSVDATPFVIKADGKVGVGTDTPAVLFDVRGQGAFASSTANPVLTITYSGAAAGLALLVEDAASPDTTPFVIDHNGRVGIGVSSPTVPLDVVGQINTTGNIQMTKVNPSLSLDAVGLTSSQIHFKKDTLDVWQQFTSGADLNMFLYRYDDTPTTPVSSTAMMIMRLTGEFGFGGVAVAGTPFTFYGDTIRLNTARTPASATAAGTLGMICWDSGFIYVCTAANTWKRAALATW